MPSATELLTHPNFLVGIAVFITLLLAGAGVIISVRRWRQQSAEGNQSAEGDLAEYQQLHEQGQLSDGEYRRITSMLEKKFSARNQNESSSG